MSSTRYNKTISENTPGFHDGQNIVAWINSDNGGVYGQNIGWDGTMGEVTPPTPLPCDPPTNFEGEYVYDDETQTYGALLTWTAPETQPLHYNLTRMDLSNFIVTGIEVTGDAVSYYDEVDLGNYWYQLTAVYENCESDYALTPDGEYYVYIEVTGLEENSNDVIVNVLNVFNMKGQRIAVSAINELNTGIYIIQGLTEDGRLVSRKVMVDRK